MTTTSSPLRPQGDIAPPPWYRQRWPWLLMLGPFVVVLAGSYTGYLAFTQQDALVVGDYYSKGKAINQDLRRDRAATGLELGAALRYDAAHATLTGQIASFGKPYAADLTLQLAHATQPEKDIKLKVRADADGKFSAALPQFEHSRWQVLIENGERDWRLDGVWIYPAQKELALRAGNTLTVAPNRAAPVE